MVVIYPVECVIHSLKKRARAIEKSHQKIVLTDLINNPFTDKFDFPPLVILPLVPAENKCNIATVQWVG